MNKLDDLGVYTIFLEGHPHQAIIPTIFRKKKTWTKMQQNALSDPRVLAGFSVPAVRRLKAVLPNTISLWPRIALHLPARQTSDMDLICDFSKLQDEGLDPQHGPARHG